MFDNDIRVATRSDAPLVIDTLTLAFAADPMSRYWWRDPSSYLKLWPSFALAMGERSFDHGSAFYVKDGMAAAMWLPPGVEPDPAQLAALELNGSAEEDEISAELQEAQLKFHPEAPHWYLWMIGVDPQWQSRGIGSALLKHTLRLVDEHQETAFLECSDPSNIPFYERHGFEVIGTIKVRDVPVLTPMIRNPR